MPDIHIVRFAERKWHKVVAKSSNSHQEKYTAWHEVEVGLHFFLAQTVVMCLSGTVTSMHILCLSVYMCNRFMPMMKPCAVILNYNYYVAVKKK